MSASSTSTALGLGARVPKTAAGRRRLAARAPRDKENTKSCVFIKGSTASNLTKKALVDLNNIKKPHSKLLTKDNEIRPFEDATSIEFLTRVNDCSQFVFASDSKKRPHTLVFGRTFDFQILDMLEFQLDPNTFRTMEEFTAERQSVARPTTKPMLCFIGDQFEHSSDLVAFKNLLLDMFRGEELKEMNLAGLDNIMVFTATADPADMRRKVVYVRNYNVLLKKSGTKLPRVELEEIGPRMDLSLNRSSYGSEEIRKASLQIPNSARKGKKKKNIEYSSTGDRMGRVHMVKQDLSQLALAKLKGLGRRPGANPRRSRAEAEASTSDASAILESERPKGSKMSKPYVGMHVSE